MAPGLGAILKLFKPRSQNERRKILRTVSSLKRRGLIAQAANEEGMRATQKGKYFLTYETLSIQKRSWDKKWRLVMFDIPESKRGARIALSRKIIEMGMRHLQDSVFISPYPCEKEIGDAARFLRVEPFIQMATAEKISNASKFLKEFGLSAK